MSTPPRPARVLVVGDSGSGKSTLAADIAVELGVPHVELDALFHGPNWTPAEDGDFRAAVEAATASGGWVADGNYGRGGVRDLLVDRAEVVVWLDLPLRITLSRIVRRTLGRQFRGEVLWNGNRERWHAWFDPEHPFWWNLRRHRDRRRTYTPMVDDRWVRLRSPAEVAAWRASL